MHYRSIVLSGPPVSGKSTLAKRLSEIYGWSVHSVGDYFRAQWRQKYPEGEIPFPQFWKKEVSHEENVRANEYMKSLVEQGHVIGDSRFSIYCKGPAVLLVYVTADFSLRAQRAMHTDRHKGETLDAVQILLAQREADELLVGRDLFGIGYDYRDPKHYHLVLNSGMLTVDDEVRIVRSLMDSH